MTTLTNSFHGTEIRVRDEARATRVLEAITADLTPAERRYARRLRDALCGSSDCSCGVVRS